MKSPRYYLSETLFRLSDLFLNLSQWVSGQEIPKTTDEQTMTLLNKLSLWQNHPCPECKGKGWVHTQTGDSAICPHCSGLDIDPEVIGRTL